MFASCATATSYSRARFSSRLSVECAVALGCIVVSTITVPRLCGFIPPADIGALKVLPAPVLDPALDHVIIRQNERVLQMQQRRD
jgi:hypothetical protein